MGLRALPAATKHTIVGAGDGPCIVVAVGARANQDGPDWGGYTVDEVALRHGVGVERETNEPTEAYAAVREAAADALPRRLAPLASVERLVHALSRLAPPSPAVADANMCS